VDIYLSHITACIAILPDILEQLFGSTTIFPEVASIRFQHQQLLEFKWCQPTRLLPFLIFNRAITRYSQPLLDRVPDMR